MSKTSKAGRRETRHIGRRVTQSILRAFDFAEDLRQPLNTYVVINLRETASACPVTVFGRIRHKYRDWLAYQAKRRGLTLSPAYVYTFENPTGSAHVNWAVHIPNELRADFEKKLERWITRSQGVCDRFTYVCKTIVKHAKSLAKYIVKGTDEAFVEHFHLDKVHAPQGSIWGKRAGVSPSLGHVARRAVNYRPRRGRRTYTPR